MISSIAFEKKMNPGPNAYKDGRGKDMSVMLKEKAKQFLYQYKPGKYDSGVKWKKTKDPAPGTYQEALAKEQCSEMRRSISNTIPKSEANRYMHIHLKNKRHVPGVGSYRTLDSYK